MRVPGTKRRRWLKVALALVASLVVTELALRTALFWPALDGTALAQSFRRAELYAHSQRDDLYWDLRDRFLERRRAPEHDALVGWTSGAFEPGTYVHRDAAKIAGRRPILLFGDSYAQGVAGAENSFEALCERSELGRGHCLLNYGVGGYGLDQVLLLMRRALDPYEGQEPFVVVGVLVDDDLDRCVLSFREWPKPRFELADGTLVPRGLPVPTYAEYAAQRRDATPSYLWRLALHGVPIVPGRARSALTGLPALERRKADLSSAILAEMQRELDARALDRLFVLFRALPSVLEPRPSAWRDATLRQALAREATVDVGEAMLAAAAAAGEEVASYYGGSPRMAGHYNARGNEVAFAAIRAGIEREVGIEAGEGSGR